MAKNSAANLLTSVDSLFTTQEERDTATQPRVQEIPIDEIDDFPNHPFKVRMDDSMMEMAESVKQHGILVPAIVRPKENGHYEMVAGHRRKLACTLIAKLQLPCIVRELTDEEATIIMVDSNLQREQLLPSEKAFAYKMKLDAMKRQGQRTDLTCATPLHKLDSRKSRDILAEQSGESHEQIRKYIRLTSLVPEILDLVDNSVLKEKDKLQIALRPAVELSYLTRQEQQDLYETMITEDCTPSHVQAMKMRKFSEEGRAIINACTELQGSDSVPLGQYRGFSMSLQYDAAHTDYKLTMKGAMSHTISLGADIFGNITRMDNLVDGLTKELDGYRTVLQDTYTQLANAKAEMETPFAKEAELAKKSARLKELNILLNMDQKDKTLLDEAPEEDATDMQKQRNLER